MNNPTGTPEQGETPARLLPGLGKKTTLLNNLQMLKAMSIKPCLESVPMPKKQRRSGPRGKYDRAEDRIRPLIIKALRKGGFRTWRVETSIQGQLGLGDLWVMHRNGYWAGWIECKRPGGKQQQVQHDFEFLCRLSGINYIILTSEIEAEKFCEKVRKTLSGGVEVI